MTTVNEKLKAVIKSSLGIDDATLADYILELSKQGESALQNELKDLPSPVLTEIMTILGFKTRELPKSSLHQQLPQVPKVNASQSQATELRSSGSLIDDSCGSKHPSSEPTDDAFIVPSLRVPDFLRDEKIDIGSSNANVTPKTPSWLDKSAEFTASKVSENNVDDAASRADRDGSRISAAKRPDRRATAPKNRSESKHELPIHAFRHEIVMAVAENPIIVVVGNTGSGKTTQITQFLHEAGYSRNNKVIACTQPRRIAAISIAQRVAYEMNAGRVGGLVGYSVRFDDCTSTETEIKYMTDGLLQREIISDPDLSNYSVVMLDEAHERTVATDVLFALLKAAVARRPDLRVIVTSATLDSEKFGAYFGGAPILHIPGKMHPVTIKWAEEPVLDYIEEALSTVKKIHQNYPLQDEAGDILVFLTGQAEIDMATAAVAKAFPSNDLIPIPVYSAIPQEMQSLIFDPAPLGTRKVVFATNIAETSLTIDGIKFVVDSGFSKVQIWDSNRGMGVLRVQPISQAQANQRSGRAGRTFPGVCYRLYTKRSYETEMPPSIVPEIQRENLANTVLLFKAMGIDDPLNFDYMDPPPRSSLISSLYELFTLGAIDDQARLTPLGREMSAFPLDPTLSKVLIKAKQTSYWCLEDALTIISMVNVPSVFIRPTRPANKKLDAEQAHRELQVSESDHLTLLKVYNEWRNSGAKKKWCDSHFLHFKNLLKAQDVRRQLNDLVTKRNKFSHGKGGNRTTNSKPPSNRDRHVQVLKALCSGYFRNVAKYIGRQNSMSSGDYSTVLGDTSVSIHPSSVLFKQRVEYVLYGSLVLTSREFMHTVSRVQPSWLTEVAPDFYREADQQDIEKRQRTDSLKPLYRKHAVHENEWRVSEQRKTIMGKKRR